MHAVDRRGFLALAALAGGAAGVGVAGGSSALAAPQRHVHPRSVTLLFEEQFRTLDLATTARPRARWRANGYEAPEQGWNDWAGSNWNWTPTTPNGATLNPFSTDSDGLVIAARRITSAQATAIGASANTGWVSGYLVQNHLAGLSYSGTFYAEARIRMEPTRGFFPAFWLFNNRADGVARKDGYESAELDVLEIFGNGDGLPWASGFHCKPSSIEGNVGYWGAPATNAWHRYGVGVSPTRISYWCDGVEMGHIQSDGVYYPDGSGGYTQHSALSVDVPAWFQHANLGVRLNLAVDPSWVAADDPTHSTPSDPAAGVVPRMHVDYVRVYSDLPFGAHVSRGRGSH